MTFLWLIAFIFFGLILGFMSGWWILLLIIALFIDIGELLL